MRPKERRRSLTLDCLAAVAITIARVLSPKQEVLPQAIYGRFARRRSGRVTAIAHRDPPTPPDMRFSASGG